MELHIFSKQEAGRYYLSWVPLKLTPIVCQCVHRFGGADTKWFQVDEPDWPSLLSIAIRYEYRIV